MTPLVLALVADRSAPPPVAPPPLLEQPAAENFALTDAVDVHIVRVPGVRKVEIAVRLHHGSWALTGGPTEAVRALGHTQDAAAGKLDPAELSTLRDLHEVALWTDVDHAWADVRLSVPLEDLAVGLDLLGQVVAEPSFPRNELQLYQRNLRLFYEVEGPASPDALARAALAYAWFPSDSPYGRRPSLDDLDDVRRSDLRGLHERWFGSAPATVLVTGDVDRASLEDGLRRALAGLGAAGPRAAPPASDPPPSAIVAVDMPGQDQVAVRLRLPWPDRDHPDRAAAWAIDAALGGFFLSRLNLNLREQKGYTYGAGTAWADTPGRATLTVATEVPVDVVGETVVEINHELRGLADGLLPQELADAALAAVQEWNGMMETASTTMVGRLGLLRDGLDVRQGRARVDAIRALDVDTTRRVATTWLANTDHRLWVFVGDRARLEPEIASLGDIRWVSARNAMLGDLP